MYSLVLAFIIFSSCLSASAKDVKISIDGLPGSISCVKEPSIEGYFCLKDEKYLIVRSFRDSFNAFGNLTEQSKDKTFIINKIENNSGKLLYESNFGGFPGSGGYGGSDVNSTPYVPPASLPTEYSDLLMKEWLFDPPIDPGQVVIARSKKFEEFVQEKLSGVKKRKREILEVFHSKEVTVSLEDGSEVTCVRGEAREKNNLDLGIENATKTTLYCGIYKCGNDKHGNERLLFKHYSLEHSFGNILYSNKKGFLDGPRVTSIKSKKSKVPLIAYDRSSFNQLGYYGTEKPELSKDNFITESLRDQSDFFKNWNMPNYEMMLRDSGRICKESSWSHFNESLKAFQDKVSNASLVQYITVVNDILTGYYLPLDQIPNGACNENGVFYNPKAYNKSTLLSPSLNQSTISLEKANELFSYAKGMNDIAWDYKQDGCYARAHLMAKRFEAKGVVVDKAWLKGELALEQENKNLIEWNFHVAPVVHVENEEGNIEKYVIDPSVFDRPVKVKEWSDKLKKSNDDVQVTSFPFPQNSAMFNRNSLAFSNSSPYLPDDNLGLTEEEKIKEANTTMTRYLGYIND